MTGRTGRVRGASRARRVDVAVRAFHLRSARTQLLVVASETHQCFGTFEGWVLDGRGERVSVDGLEGRVEEARQRW